MTDEAIINEINEILVYLEDEGEYHLDKDCDTEWLLAVKEVLNFFNRQQAVIERLQGAVQEWVDGKCLSQKHLLMIGNLQNEIEQAKSEGYKEGYKEGAKSFAEKLTGWTFTQEKINNILAEMAGEQNA